MWAIAFLDGPVLSHFVLYYYILKLSNRLRRGLIAATLVFVIVGNPKRDLGAVKGHPGGPKDIFGAWKSSEGFETISRKLKWPWEPQTKCFWVSNGHRGTRRDLGGI